MFSGKKADCPFWRGACKGHGCRFFIQIQGINPNDGQQVNKWGCAIEFLPMLLIENAQQSRQAGASADKVATEVRALHDEVATANKVTLTALAAPHSKSGPKLIGGKRGSDV